jgi:phi LC3 family holin
MKINWKARFKNKTFLITFAALLVGFVYQILGLFGIVPPISEASIVNVITIAINVLGMFGVVVDPTTPGAKDSDRAMTYYTDADESVTTE